MEVNASGGVEPDQSEFSQKFDELLGRASALLGSRVEAELWIEKPAIALGGRKPSDLLSTPAGVKLVEDHLTRLEHGVYT